MSNPALVHDFSEIKFTLKNINWDFFPIGSTNSNQISPFNCRKYHWLPATFVAEIPFTLIEVLTFPRAVVYDPFGGIGTTFFQALLLNRMPLTTENNKILIDFIENLFILFNPIADYNKIGSVIETICEKYDEKIKYTTKISTDSRFHNLSRWYSPKTYNQLSYLYLENESCDDKLIKALIHISVSSILKGVSSQDRGYGCIADNVIPKKHQIKDKDALSLFKKHAVNLITDIRSQYKKQGANELKKNYKNITELHPIIHQDIKSQSPIRENSVDLIVTSPPYPKMVDYVKSQRLSYYFFDINMDKDLKCEIGARYKRYKPDALQIYLDEMNIANENIANKLKEGGYICYIMPAFNTDNRNNHDRKKIVNEVIDNMKNFGLKEEIVLERIIPSRRRLHNVKWATLEKENILIYRKCG